MHNRANPLCLMLTISRKRITKCLFHQSSMGQTFKKLFPGWALKAKLSDINYHVLIETDKVRIRVLYYHVERETSLNPCVNNLTRQSSRVNIFYCFTQMDLSLVLIFTRWLCPEFFKSNCFLQLWIRKRLRFLDRACEKQYLLKPRS